MDAAGCPHCSAPRVLGLECPRCGVIYSRAEPRVAAEPIVAREAPHYAPAIEAPVVEWKGEAEDEAIEHRLRLVALPAALLGTRLIVAMAFPHLLLRTFLAMWVHESGHAVAAWLCGYVAFPLPWVTLRGLERSPLFALGLAAALGYGLWRSLAVRSRLGAVTCGSILVLQAIGTLWLRPSTAEVLFTFAGDGGGMVLGALLMATFYAPPQSSLRTGWLRWGFLVIGAASFTDVFEQWWAARTDTDRIPFGQIERVGDSDPTKLVEEFGWSVTQLVHRYVMLGCACLIGLALLYAWGLRRPRQA